jgi:hypothetical protein
MPANNVESDLEQTVTYVNQRRENYDPPRFHINTELWYRLHGRLNSHPLNANKP